jgi:hypothetical protein
VTFLAMTEQNSTPGPRSANAKVYRTVRANFEKRNPKDVEITFAIEHDEMVMGLGGSPGARSLAKWEIDTAWRSIWI